MIILPGADKSTSDWSRENGKEVAFYDKNHTTNHVIMTSPMHPPRFGYARYKTTDPKEMDRVFRKLNEQERESNEKTIEKLWSRGRERYDQLRSNLNQRLVTAGTSEWEKAFIREALKLMAERDHASQQNTRYGISAMEESEAPVAGGRKTVN